MPVVKAGRSRQVVIPKAIWDSLGLAPGDYFEVELEDDRIVFVPKKLVSKEELWYWSREGQAEIQQALRELEEGKAKEFDDVEELIEELNT
ncbi:MAG: AbrB/MazE/SpoVT family DNA-binding domain-containing protein [Candidatus Bipolaricaulia bacterium]